MATPYVLEVPHRAGGDIISLGDFTKKSISVAKTMRCFTAASEKKEILFQGILLSSPLKIVFRRFETTAALKRVTGNRGIQESV